MNPSLALLQIDLTAGAVARNVAQIKRAVSGAVLTAGGGDLLCVAPELAVSGSPLGDLPNQTGFLETCRDALTGLAKEFRTGPAILLGAPERKSGVPVSTLFLLNEGVVTSLGSRPLAIATAFGPAHRTPLADDARYGTFPLFGLVFAVRPGLVAGGAVPTCDIIVCPDNEAFEPGLFAERGLTCRALAMTLGKPIISLNAVGGNGPHVCHGGSLVCDASGEIHLALPNWRQELVIDELARLTLPNAMCTEQPVETQADPMDAIGNAILLGMRDFVRKSGFSRVCLGLSGGMDSALVAALAVEAFGANNVDVILLPSPYTSEESLADANQLAANLGLKTQNVDIAPMMDAFARAFPAPLERIAAENLQSRIRGTVMMAHSNRSGALLLATSNKSEAAVGYGTLYGDMAGGLMPIADVYKTDVYRLAEWFNKRKGFQAIPRNIFEKAPTAELHPGQRDSDSLPPYEVLDAALRVIFEGRTLSEKAECPSIDGQTVSVVAELVRKSEFKRRQSPQTLYVSSCPLALAARPLPAAKVL